MAEWNKQKHDQVKANLVGETIIGDCMSCLDEAVRLLAGCYDQNDKWQELIADFLRRWNGEKKDEGCDICNP